MDSVCIDGMDITNTYPAMKALRRHSGESPSRVCRHEVLSLQGPFGFRSEEVPNPGGGAGERGQRPDRAWQVLISSGVMEEEDIKAMNKELRSEIREAVKFAGSPSLESKNCTRTCTSKWGPTRAHPCRTT